jgi:hypothetical protein
VQPSWRCSREGMSALFAEQLARIVYDREYNRSFFAAASLLWSTSHHLHSHNINHGVCNYRRRRYQVAACFKKYKDENHVSQATQVVYRSLEHPVFILYQHMFRISLTSAIARYINVDHKLTTLCREPVCCGHQRGGAAMV